MQKPENVARAVRYLNQASECLRAANALATQTPESLGIAARLAKMQTETAQYAQYIDMYFDSPPPVATE